MLLKAERQALQALPAEEFPFFEREIRKVGINCHINFQNAYYSVPSRFVGQEVTVRFNDRILRIIHAGEQIALHARSYAEGTFVTVREHLPEHKVYSETERQLRAEEKMRSIGENSHEYFRVLLKTKPGYWTQTVRGILGLSGKYEAAEIDLSLKRALFYGATEVPTIRHILEKKLYLLPLEPPLPKTADEEPAGARELTYYTVYDARSLPLPV